MDGMVVLLVILLLMLIVVGVSMMIGCLCESWWGGEPPADEILQASDRELERELEAIRRIGDEGRQQVRLLATEVESMVRTTSEKVK